MIQYIIFAIFAVFLLTSCSTRGSGVYKPKIDMSNDDFNFDYDNNSIKKRYSHYTMKPYTIKGVTYYPKHVSIGDTFSGRASWYGPNFHGKLTSNGEKYNMYDMTAAHKTLPMNTIVEVTNRNNGKKTIVRINDRGPFVASRIIDLSKMAARELGIIKTGTAPVTLKVIGFADPQVKKKSKVKKKKSRLKKHNGYYYLQIASFSNIDGAIAIQEQYDGIDGYKTIIKDVEDGYGRVFKVLLGKFASREAAYSYKNRAGFIHAFIVKED